MSPDRAGWRTRGRRVYMMCKCDRVWVCTIVCVCVIFGRIGLCGTALLRHAGKSSLLKLYTGVAAPTSRTLHAARQTANAPSIQPPALSEAAAMRHGLAARTPLALMVRVCT